MNLDYSISVHTTLLNKIHDELEKLVITVHYRWEFVITFQSNVILIVSILPKTFVIIKELWD